ncbi:hypothetical protein NE237_004727 [Protea cynaroides]|uniref:Uncharacterized protein n=1 Tax=Protea cynaroides TaxID=273540 RepID=A0A9Q0KJ56_9MAGN|nr:hypothetical protein NE237_004727 [Protea cynaroides]
MCVAGCLQKGSLDKRKTGFSEVWNRAYCERDASRAGLDEMRPFGEAKSISGHQTLQLMRRAIGIQAELARAEADRARLQRELEEKRRKMLYFVVLGMMMIPHPRHGTNNHDPIPNRVFFVLWWDHSQGPLRPPKKREISAHHPIEKTNPYRQADPRIVNEAPKECREKVWNRREQTTNSREGCTGRLLLRSLIESFPLLP